ncbi:hypothetical protein NQ186_16510 [Pseudomonas zeae]|uniref:hypothetical protein n=1 Tax=Pseudomonas zeae TaxID=2745510 RepID=UPI002147B1CD|nr:hypothetical protein [Pseudomonas zeae]UUT10275.1 hypothetical protein NQ186_16510 [Pseudomonas zeae]
MTTSTPPDNTVLVLYPPKVNGQTTPVVGAHIGVPLVASDLVADGKGAVVIVDPPLSGTMDPGDVMELWLEGESATLDSETITNPNAKTQLRTKGRLHPDKVNKLYYTVMRGSDNIGTSTPSLEILYNRVRPGLKDRFPQIDGHSELDLDLSDLIKQGVGKDFVSAPVCFSYPYCRAYDTISLKCNGEIKTFAVSKDQAPEPPNPGSEMPTTVCFTVEREFLDKAKRQNKVLNFSYTVTDQLLNGPDPDAVWSAAVAVNEDLDGSLLDKPILLERKEDYPGDDAETIDLEKLAGNPLLLVVMTKDNRFEVGDEIVATYTATGQTDPVVVRGKVEEDPFLGKLPCFLEVPNDKVFADSKVTATYELRRPNGDLVGNSNTAIATVTGSTPIKLLPPFLVDAVEPIDILAYPNGVTVRIKYLEALSGDRARLVEVNPPAGSPQFPLVEFNSEKQVDTVLSAAFMAARHGKNIGFRWNLNRNNAQAGKSPVATFSVLKIADGDSRLPTPCIAGETSNSLDVTKLLSRDLLQSVKWLHQTPGQTVWGVYEGISDKGEAITCIEPNGEPIKLIGDFEWPIPVKWLKTLQHGSDLRVKLMINSNGTSDRSEAVSTPTRVYRVQRQILQLTESFNSFPPFVSTEEGEFITPNITITTRKTSSAAIAWAIETTEGENYFPAKIDGRHFAINAAKTEFNFGRTCSRVSFWYTHVDFGNHRVEVRDDTGFLLDSKILQLNRGVRADQLVFNHDNIYSVIVIPDSSESLVFDNFELTTQ